jgi:hypothetical protein
VFGFHNFVEAHYRNIRVGTNREVSYRQSHRVSQLAAAEERETASDNLLIIKEIVLQISLLTGD